MKFGTLVCVIMIVQSGIFILIKGEHIKLRGKRFKSVVDSKIGLYDRVKLNSDFKVFTNSVNREPKSLSTRISQTQRVRIATPNKSRAKLRHRVPVLRKMPTRHGPNIPRRTFSKSRNKFGRSMIRGFRRNSKTHPVPVKRHHKIKMIRDEILDYDYYGQNRVDKITKPIKIIKTTGQTIKLSTSLKNDAKTEQFDVNNRSNNKLHALRIDMPLIFTNGTPSVATKRHIWKKLKTSKTLPDKHSILEAKPQQATKVFDRARKISHETVSPSSIPLRMFIPTLKSYRNMYKGRKKKQRTHKLRQTMTKSNKPKFTSFNKNVTTSTGIQWKHITIRTTVKDVKEQNDTSSFLTLLKSRRPKTRNELDEHMIRKHLLALESMRDGDSNKTSVLIRQMQYVKTIAVFNIQREVLKLLVKYTIEKSGIMNTDTRHADFRTLINLNTIVNQITAEFTDSTLSVTVPTKTNPGQQQVQEPIGGDVAYWTHLSGGIADMVCNLCKGQAVDDCVIRYCSDDNQATDNNADLSKTVDE